MPEFIAKAWNHSCTSSVSNEPTLSRTNSALNTRNGRPEMSIATRVKRLVHRHVHVGIARDALHVAERLLHRLAERDADVLGGVVVIDMQVALGLDRDVDARVPRQQVEHVVEEADAGRNGRTPGAVEIDFDLDVGFLGLALHGRFAHGICPSVARLLSGVAGIRHRRCGPFANAARHA